jgi:predicted permease
VIRDISLGCRLLWRDRTYSVTAVLTLAVCIAANTAIFTIVNAVLLKPLPVPESDRILLMSNQYPHAASTGVAGFTNSGVPDYYDRLDTLTVFDEQAMFNGTTQSFEINGGPELIRGMATTPSLFRLLRVPPAQGRIFDETEGETGNEQKVILGYGLAQQLFGGVSAAIGQQVRMGGRPFAVIGVMPPAFQFADSEVRFWIPLAFTAQQRSDDARHSNNWRNVGRLRAGATIAQAQEQVNALNAANLSRFPQFRQILVNAGFYTRVERLQDVLVRSVKPMLYLLWGGAMVVLLIGGVNIANLALARSHVRAKELATRVALGAGGARVVRLLVVEGLLVAGAGGTIGIAGGWAVLRASSTIGLDRLPRATEIHIDVTAVAVALALSAAVGTLAGLVPTAHLMNADLRSLLHEEGRSGTGGRKARAVRRALIVAQVAFAFVLLIGAGLLLASFRHLLAVDPGFKSERVLTLGIGIPQVRYSSDSDVRAFTNRALESIRRIPGVVNAGGTTLIPLGGNHSDSVILAEGYRMQPGESLVSPMQVMITPGYVEAMSTPLVRGRLFDDGDNETAPGVVIVDERLARKFWPVTDPIGRRMFKPTNPRDILSVDEHTRWLTVVGVIREVLIDDLAGVPGTVGAYYLPAAQMAPRGLVLSVKTNRDPAAVWPPIRTALRNVDPQMAFSDVQTMTNRTALSLTPRRAAMLIALSFGLVALFLSGVGVYGVLAYLVAQRTREIGIRMALGGTARSVFRLVLRDGLTLVAVGLALGLVGIVALRNALQGEIYGVSTLSPAVIGPVMMTLGTIALVACVVPARRAMRINPAAILGN